MCISQCIMAWIYLFFCVALSTSFAYNPVYYPSFYNQDFAASQYRRVDEAGETGPADDYQTRPGYQGRSIEGSIPFRSEPQRVQERGELRTQEMHARNGNTTYKNVNNFRNGYPSVGNRAGIADSDTVVFPGPISRRSSLFVPQEIPPECQEMGICENIPNYPHDFVDNLIAQTADAELMFNLDLETPKIAQRGGQDVEDLEICQYNQTIVYPTAAKNIQGKWVYIINKKEVKVQGFKTEVCAHADKPCDTIIRFPKNYNSSCLQKHVDRQMWAVNEEGKMKIEIISLPSCCTCILQYHHHKSRNV